MWSHRTWLEEKASELFYSHPALEFSLSQSITVTKSVFVDGSKQEEETQDEWLLSSFVSLHLIKLLQFLSGIQFFHTFTYRQILFFPDTSVIFPFCWGGCWSSNNEVHSVVQFLGKINLQIVEQNTFKMSLSGLFAKTQEKQRHYANYDFCLTVICSHQ